MNDKYISIGNINDIVRLYATKSIKFNMNKKFKKIEKVMIRLRSTKQIIKDKIVNKTSSVEKNSPVIQETIQTQNNGLEDERKYFKRSRESFKRLKLYYKLKKTQAIDKKNNLIQNLHNKYDKYHELKTNKKEMKVMARRGLLLTFGLSNILFLYLKFSNKINFGFLKFFLFSGFIFLSTNVLTQMWLNYKYMEELRKYTS
jgi:hypothetical protein